MRVLPEAIYGKPERRSVDWIIEDPSATLFIECKLARPALAAQTMISESDPLGTALKRLADAVAQTYATLRSTAIHAVMHYKVCGEAREWMLQPYLTQHFAGALRREAPIFATQINAIIYGPSRFTRMLFKPETSG